MWVQRWGSPLRLISGGCCVNSLLLLLCGPLLREEAIRFPRRLITGQEQCGSLQRRIEGLAYCGEADCPIRILDLDEPRAALCLDCEPPWLTRLPVIVLADGAVFDQLHQVRETVRLHWR
jgi:hypothetical protein